MTLAFVGLGANLGDAAATVRAALADLDHIPRSTVTGRSRLYRSAAVGPAPQPDYVNAVARLETGLSPHELLDALLGVEARHGRVRDGTRWGPRTLDLDLLLHGEAVLADGRLTLPHPEITRRNFVLAPLLELAPEILVPGQGSAREALARVGLAGLAALDLPATPGA